MRRSAGIANALAVSGADVRVASGTFVDRRKFFRSNIRFIDLPEHRVYNKKLNIWYHYDLNGQKIQDKDFDEKTWRTKRDDVIIKALQDQPVHAVLVEFWPFSRRREFSSTIDRISKANPGKFGKPLIFSSSRDILETANSMKKGPEQIDKEQRKTVELILKYVDRVFIHGDPKLVRIEQEFKYWKQISTKALYTGYVVNETARPNPNHPRRERVVVSVGSGSAGLGLILAAARTRPHTDLRKHTWIYVLGPRMQPEERARARREILELEKSQAGQLGKTEVHDHRPDLPKLLASAGFSISLGGYNTTLEMLVSGVPGVLVPKFVERNKDKPWADAEQKLRLIKLAKKGFVHMAYPNTAIRAPNFGGLINRAYRERNTRATLDFNGAENTARYVLEMIAQRFQLKP